MRTIFVGAPNRAVFQPDDVGKIWEFSLRAAEPEFLSEARINNGALACEAGGSSTINQAFVCEAFANLVSLEQDITWNPCCQNAYDEPFGCVMRVHSGDVFWNGNRNTPVTTFPFDRHAICLPPALALPTGSPTGFPREPAPSTPTPSASPTASDVLQLSIGRRNMIFFFVQP